MTQELYQEAMKFAGEKHREVCLVKLADRITNLQQPPADWTGVKILHYAKDAQLILDELREGNAYLSRRLETKIDEYLIEKK